MIKVKVGFNYVIIFHIYPTEYKEKCSGRGGQNLIIGYIIRKCVYKYILKQSIIYKEFWILVDCNDVCYYDLKNIHLINFIENNN